jgi:hypothetical protein
MVYTIMNQQVSIAIGIYGLYLSGPYCLRGLFRLGQGLDQEGKENTPIDSEFRVAPAMIRNKASANSFSNRKAPAFPAFCLV